MSGEHRRTRGCLLPVIVLIAGAYLLINGFRNGTLSTVNLKLVNYIGIMSVIIGVLCVFGKKPVLKMLGLAVSVIGAIMVIYL